LIWFPNASFPPLFSSLEKSLRAEQITPGTIMIWGGPVPAKAGTGAGA